MADLGLPGPSAPSICRDIWSTWSVWPGLFSCSCSCIAAWIHGSKTAADQLPCHISVPGESRAHFCTGKESMLGLLFASYPHPPFLLPMLFLRRFAIPIPICKPARLLPSFLFYAAACLRCRACQSSRMTEVGKGSVRALYRKTPTGVRQTTPRCARRSAQNSGTTRVFLQPAPSIQPCAGARSIISVLVHCISRRIAHHRNSRSVCPHRQERIGLVSCRLPCLPFAPLPP